MTLPLFPLRDPNVHPADTPRLSRQCADILAMLREGPRLNVDLARVSLKYTSRVSDLRAAGFVIECVRLGDGVTRYTLKNGT